MNLSAVKPANKYSLHQNPAGCKTNCRQTRTVNRCAACRNDKVANNYYAAYCTYNYCRRGGHARKTYIQTGTSEMAIKKGKIWI